MKRLTQAMAVALLVVGSAPARSQTTPPRVVESWGVCPFECCTYREWSADDSIAVHAKRDEHSPVVFTLQQGQSVKGVDGVVVTERPVAFKLDHDVRDGYIDGSEVAQLSLHAGDTIYLLTPLGEGAFRFWYRGKTYNSGTELGAMPDLTRKGSSMVWWKQVKNRAGKSGWTSSSKFSHVDACG